MKTLGKRSAARGFSMLETLVTLLIIAIWMLGSAGVQSIALKMNKSSAMRNQAILLAAEVGERMENNRSAAAVGKYEIKKKEPKSKSDCTSKACSPNQLAEHDLAEVYNRANDYGFDIEIKRTSGERAEDPTVTYSIEVSWIDRKGSQAYANGADESGMYLGSKTIFKPIPFPTNGKA